jgi:uncharacterized membrane-anchored protein
MPAHRFPPSWSVEEYTDACFVVRDFGTTELAMRERLLFVLSVAMLVSGLYLLMAELFWLDERYGFMVLIAVTLVAMGAYLLWADFIASALGIKDKQ